MGRSVGVGLGLGVGVGCVREWGLKTCAAISAIAFRAKKGIST